MCRDNENGRGFEYAPRNTLRRTKSVRGAHAVTEGDAFSISRSAASDLKMLCLDQELAQCALIRNVRRLPLGRSPRCVWPQRRAARARKRESEQAGALLARDTKRRDELTKMFEDLERSASYAEGDARQIEQGLPMTFEPNRFDEPE